MPTFQYEAMNSDGKTVRNTIAARDQDDAISKIRDLNLFPTRVKEATEKKTAGGRAGSRAQRPGRRGGGIVIGGVRNKDLTTFTRQLSTLTDAGIPVVQSLNILENQMRPCALKNIVGAVAGDVESGSALSEAMARYPKAYDDLYVNMVKAGEAGGVLDTVLQRLAEFREKAARLKRKIIGAMIYPVAVLSFAMIILSLIVIFIIPNFTKMFVEMSIQLPLPTRILIGVSNFCVTYWYLLPGFPIALVAAYRLFRATKTGKRVLDWVKFHVPLFGTISRKGAIARFTRTFGTLIASGVPILEALNISRDTAGNVLLASAIANVHDSVREGEPIASPLGESDLFDDMVVNMIDVGEETGNLDSMLLKIADNYDDEVDTAVESLTSLMEPIMIIGLGLIIGFIVVSLFLPLIALMGSLS
jgi:type IV pilus assembly protein PilC